MAGRGHELWTIMNLSGAHLLHHFQDRISGRCTGFKGRVHGLAKISLHLPKISQAKKIVVLGKVFVCFHNRPSTQHQQTTFPSGILLVFWSWCPADVSTSLHCLPLFWSQFRWNKTNLSFNALPCSTDLWVRVPAPDFQQLFDARESGKSQGSWYQQESPLEVAWCCTMLH